MNKIDFSFKGFKIENRLDKHQLILLVANDMAASIVYPILSTSTSVSLRYKIVDNHYFDLFIILNDLNSYYEINVAVDDTTPELSKAIDRATLTNLWVAFYIGADLQGWGTAIQVHN